MKKNLRWMFIRLLCTTCAITILTTDSIAQTLWGMTSDGGSKKSGGNIFTIKEDGTGFKEQYAFLHDGQNPTGQQLLNYGDGYLYGATDEIIFRLHFDGSGYQILYVFQEATGSGMTSGLLKGSDGYLYGVTQKGGAWDNGVVYKVKKDGTGYQLLHEFKGSDGSWPFGELIQLSSGTLYGVTIVGGNSDKGTIFRIEPDGTGFQSLHSFNETNGMQPNRGLTPVTINGTTYLYGVTMDGGSGYDGVLYRIKPDGTNFSVLINFRTDVQAGGPRGPLLKIGKILYGTTNATGALNDDGEIYDGGVVFAYDASSDSYQKLHQFDYQYYNDDLVRIATTQLLNIDGVLYGTAATGGAFQNGVIYKLNTDGSGYQEIHQFEDVIDADGNILEVNNQIYGLTNKSYSSTGMNGTIYKVNTDGSSYQVIHSFDVPNGYGPTGSLILGQNKKIYGQASFGGSSYRNGVAFSLENDGSNFYPLASLGNFGLGNAQGSIMQATNGSFYGMRDRGGAAYTYPGEIYKITLGSPFVYTDFYDPFCSGTGCGSYPAGSFMQANDGYLYGMTTTSSYNDDYGTIFRIGTDGTGFTILKTFNGTNGAHPLGALIQGPDNRLYGMTANGGSGSFGTIFRIKTDGTGFQTLLEFGSSSLLTYGTHPNGKLLFGSDGKLYGMASGGGTGWGGTIFRLNTDGTGLSVVYNFNSSSGYYPLGSLIEDTGNGYLFGMTELGGTSGMGTIFKVKKDGTGFQALLNFDGINGKYPKGDLLLVPWTINISGPPVPITSAQKNSINEQNISSGSSSISVFPNPVKQSFTIRFQNSFSGNAEYSLADLTGKILLKQTINHSSFAEMKSVDISYLPPGTYLLEVTTPKEKFTQKIVKQ